MQVTYFTNGGFAIHKARVAGSLCSAWYTADGMLVDSEYRSAASPTHDMKPVKRGGPIWKAMAVYGPIYRKPSEARE